MMAGRLAKRILLGGLLINFVCALYLQKCVQPARVAGDVLEGFRQTEIANRKKYGFYAEWGQLLGNPYLKEGLRIIESAYVVKADIQESKFSIVALPRIGCFCMATHYVDDHTSEIEFFRRKAVTE